MPDILDDILIGHVICDPMDGELVLMKTNCSTEDRLKDFAMVVLLD